MTIEVLRYSKFVKKCDWGTGDARLYRLYGGVATYQKRDADSNKYVDKTTEYVAVSGISVVLDFLPHDYSPYETFIFPADKDGEVLDWLELDGSFRGSIDHEKALTNLGFPPV